MTANLRVEVIETTAGLEAIRPEWEHLYAAATGGINPFLRWTWLWHWWRSVSRRSGWPHSDLQLLVMRDGNGQARAAVPYFLGTWGIGPLAFRSLRLYGFHTTLTDLRTPMVWPGWEAAAAHALTASLERLRERYHLCVLDGLAEGDPFTHHMAGEARHNGWRWGRPLQSFVRPLPSSWDELRASLTRNNRGSIQQGYNALKRDGRTFCFEVLTDPSEIPGALDTLLRLHAARAARRAGPRHNDYYADPEDRAFLRAVAADFAAEGLLRVCHLRVDGSVVASRIVLSAGPDLYLYHSGHDPAWSRYRVGTLLTAECVKMAIRLRAGAVHFGTGAEVSKLRWGPRTETFDELQIIAPTAEGRLLGRAAQQGIVLSRRIRDRWPHRSWHFRNLSIPQLARARTARARS